MVPPILPGPAGAGRAARFRCGSSWLRYLLSCNGESSGRPTGPFGRASSGIHSPGAAAPDFQHVSGSLGRACLLTSSHHRLPCVIESNFTIRVKGCQEKMCPEGRGRGCAAIFWPPGSGDSGMPPGTSSPGSGFGGPGGRLRGLRCIPGCPGVP